MANNQALTPSYWALERSKVPLVYFITSEAGPIKIGLSECPQARVHHMQSHSPSKLTLAAIDEGGRERERHYHERFAMHRLHGEWFSPASDILETIASLNQQGVADAA